jgi:hypothetical protein
MYVTFFYFSNMKGSAWRWWLDGYGIKSVAWWPWQNQSFQRYLSHPTTLACIKAPKWFYKEMDNRRLGYFWTIENTVSRGHCKIAWDVVCRPIEGGLNIKNLEIQNLCLLLKFIHKLHKTRNCFWVKWIQSFIYQGNKRPRDKVSSCSNSWRYLVTLIQL